MFVCLKPLSIWLYKRFFPLTDFFYFTTIIPHSQVSRWDTLKDNDTWPEMFPKAVKCQRIGSLDLVPLSLLHSTSLSSVSSGLSCGERTAGLTPGCKHCLVPVIGFVLWQAFPHQVKIQWKWLPLPNPVANADFQLPSHGLEVGVPKGTGEFDVEPWSRVSPIELA